MSDLNTIRLRQVARLKMLQDIELTPEEEFALTDFVPVSSCYREDDGRHRKKPYIRPFKALEGRYGEVKAMRDQGLSMEQIANKCMVGVTMIREYFIANGIDTKKIKK